MSDYQKNMIANRLSLRKPLRESLGILQKITEILTLEKEPNVADSLKILQTEYPHFKSFDRDFVSVCFAIATGVGKTRLMGAFISYLYLSEGIRHFMVLAPNLTIYNKLINDFTPNTPKYVFKGIGEFAQTAPIVITGDNYESGLGVRGTDLFNHDIVHINIFNISKITAKDKGHFAHDDERKSLPRFRRLREEMGESYFNYLANLDDLVVLMDESHRYRADAGMTAINELKPILGLELTATPQVEKGQKSVPFENVIYHYPLSLAMDDGYVKEPAVATRENFDSKIFSEDALEKIKLEDGIHVHTQTKIDLEIYARDNDLGIVKPFVLVVAQDTEHANTIRKYMESNEFFEGKYKDKVITVHSKNTKGNEGDEIVQQLMTVEDPKNVVEIVVHVNMLKEGWDVTNLYTIIPLRAANSKTLVEQSIGRGLRLPYGKRVGEKAVDRLTIISHDKFQEIVDHANDPNSIIREGVIIGKDIPMKGKRLTVVGSRLEDLIDSKDEEHKLPEASFSLKSKGTPLFENSDEKKVAKITFNLLKQFEYLKNSKELQTKIIQDELIQKVQDEIAPLQAELKFEEKIDVTKIVKKTTKLFSEMSIDIPKIVVVPKGEVKCGYNKFTLDLSNLQVQPVSQDILIQHLRDRERYTLKNGVPIAVEKRLEDYVIRGLIDFDDISYDDHSKILFDLASQLVNHLKGYLGAEDEIVNVLQYHQQVISKLIHSQMQDHFYESAIDYEAEVIKGFQTLKSNNYEYPENEKIREFRSLIPEGKKSQIKSMLFGGFERCLYPVQKFDSDSERRFAIIIENGKDTIKWFKPAKGNFQIHYSTTKSYEPDFVVETEKCKYLCEPKMEKEMDSDVVIAKARAASLWCKRATEFSTEIDGKPWKYLLIPHNQIKEQKTLDGLAAGYEFKD